MVTLTQVQPRASVPSVPVAGVDWPYDKIALVVGALVAVVLALIVTGSGEVASWAGVSVGIAALLVTRRHYGVAATAPAS